MCNQQAFCTCIIIRYYNKILFDHRFKIQINSNEHDFEYFGWSRLEHYNAPGPHAIADESLQLSSEARARSTLVPAGLGPVHVFRCRDRVSH